MTQNDKLLVFDASKLLHINAVYAALGQVAKVRGRYQEVVTSHDAKNIDAILAKGWNDQRDQIDVFQLGTVLSQDNWLCEDSKDVLKLFITDREIYDSTNHMNYGLGVTLSFDSGSTCVFISTPYVGDVVHAQHVILHEIGHAYGAPNPLRSDVYESLGAHCSDRDCTMHQELNLAESKRSAHRIARLPRAFCNNCAYDIKEYRR